MIPFHWLCKDLQGTGSFVYICPAVVWVSERRVWCAVSLLLTQGKTRQIKKRFSGMAWLPKEGQIWDSAVCTEWSKEQKLRHSAASWYMNLILNNHRAFSHDNSLLHLQARMMLSEGHTGKDWEQDIAVPLASSGCHDSVLGQQITDFLSRAQNQFSIEWEFEHRVPAKQWEAGSQKRQEVVNQCKKKQEGSSAWQCGNTAVEPPEIR